MAIAGQDLTMSFEDKWYPTNEGNAEEIFSVQYERNGYPGNVLTGGHTRQSTYGSQLGDPAVTGLKNCNGALVPSTKSLYLWAKGDARYEATFMTTMYNYFGSWPATGYYAYYEASEAARSTMGIADKYFPWYYTKNEVDAYITEHADFNKEAQRVAAKMRFKPAKRGKEKVRSRYDVTFPIRHGRLSFIELKTIDV